MQGEGTGAHGLSQRELEVLELLRRGLSRKAIAAELHLSPCTVSAHVSNILRKLDCSSAVSAVQLHGGRDDALGLPTALAPLL